MLKKRGVFIGLLLLVLLVIMSYLTINTYGNWQFAWALRSKKIVAFLLVALATSSATISFQTITQNQFLTPSVLGLDSLCLSSNGPFLYRWGCDHASANRDWLFFDKYCVNGWLESITLFLFTKERTNELVFAFDDWCHLRDFVQ